MAVFYNTIKATDPELDQYQQKARTQSDVILTFFRKNAGKEFTPGEVHAGCPELKMTPITSVRRAITNLTEMGSLVKTHHQRPGRYGKMNHCWYYPAVARQGKLF